MFNSKNQVKLSLYEDGSTQGLTPILIEDYDNFVNEHLVETKNLIDKWNENLGLAKNNEEFKLLLGFDKDERFQMFCVDEFADPMPDFLLANQICVLKQNTNTMQMAKTALNSYVKYCNRMLIWFENNNDKDTARLLKRYETDYDDVADDMFFTPKSYIDYLCFQFDGNWTKDNKYVIDHIGCRFIANDIEYFINKVLTSPHLSEMLNRNNFITAILLSLMLDRYNNDGKITPATSTLLDYIKKCGKQLSPKNQALLNELLEK